jgi:hypothetical protein
MSVACAQLQEDWELFVLGSLDEAAQQRMASHLRSGCAECLHRYIEAQTAVTSIAASAPPRQPSAQVERELMKRVRGQQNSGLAWAWPRWALVPWAVAAACLLISGWLFVQQRTLSQELLAARQEIANYEGQSQVSTSTSSTSSVPTPSTQPVQPQFFSQNAAGARDRKKLAELELEIAELRNKYAAAEAASAAAAQKTAELEAELGSAQARSNALARDFEAANKKSTAATQAQIVSLNEQLSASRAEVNRLGQMTARNAQIESLLQSGSIQQIDLRAVDMAAGKASARVIYSPKGGLLLVADSLPRLDHEKCYQLWLIRKGAPAILSGGLLQLSDDGHGFLFAPPTTELAQLTGLAITDEPKGGSVSARGHKLLFGARSN